MLHQKGPPRPRAWSYDTKGRPRYCLQHMANLLKHQSHSSSFPFFSSTGVELGLSLTRQMLSCVSHSASLFFPHFCTFLFWVRLQYLWAMLYLAAGTYAI
jgi:hypothetical protein